MGYDGLCTGQTSKIRGVHGWRYHDAVNTTRNHGVQLHVFAFNPFVRLADENGITMFLRLVLHTADYRSEEMPVDAGYDDAYAVSPIHA